MGERSVRIRDRMSARQDYEPIVRPNMPEADFVEPLRESLKVMPVIALGGFAASETEPARCEPDEVASLKRKL
jgi:hypothetical protein